MTLHELALKSGAVYFQQPGAAKPTYVFSANELEKLVESVDAIDTTPEPVEKAPEIRHEHDCGGAHHHRYVGHFGD